MTHEELDHNLLEALRFSLHQFGVDIHQVYLKNNNITIKPHELDLNEVKSQLDWGNIPLIIETGEYEDNKIYLSFSRKMESLSQADESLDDKRVEFCKLIERAVSEIFSSYYEELSKLNESMTVEERIPKKLSKNFKISETLSDVKNWQAKVVVANSAGRDAPDIGQFDKVGYVMIGLKTGTIVPIARSDEHHKGYDLMHEYLDKGLIPKDKYYAIFASQDFVDANDAEALEAFKIWRKLGGPNVLINSWNGPSFQITMDDYIKLEGDIKLSKGELFPVGERLISNLEKLAELTRGVRSGKVKDKFAYTQAVKVYNIFRTQVEKYPKDEDDITTQIFTAESLGGSEGIQKLEELFFGFGSFKNKLHIEIREAIKGDTWKKKDMVAIFGDLELAFHRLGSI